MQSAAALPSTLSDLFHVILRDRQGYFARLFEEPEAGAQVGLLLGIIVPLAAFYGLIMGGPGGVRPALASAVKVPALFLISLFVTFPALYVVSILIGSALSIGQMLAMILLAVAVATVILAAAGPIALFFALTGSGYHFMKLLHVGAFTVSGLWGMNVLWSGLLRMAKASDLYPGSGLLIMMLWIVLYAFIAAQLAWTLRPFIGEPSLPFRIFRPRDRQMNFYSTVALSWSEMGRRNRGAGRA